ncbi:MULTISPECIES: LysR family substrate-binding domain-containing protein [unclassified Streptomyces]|uniref:LysR family substrate-binding domain-containing protein n=1 Tax=unclassified Streptomyces TaxID=2593676 RepID=UPI003D70D009
MTDSADHPTFRLAHVPGVMPAKWVRVWNERHPDTPLTLLQATAAEACDLLRDGSADAGLVRLPVDRTVLSAIPLYTETTVVVVPKDHLATAVEEVALDDLSDEVVLHPLDDVLPWHGMPPGEPAFERPATTADAVELVAAGIGVLYVPQSLARLHHRRDLTYRPVTDAPRSGVVLSWPQDATTDEVDDFIGIVRGRTVNSTRGRTRPAPAAEEKKQQPRKSTGARTGGGQKGGGQKGSGQKAAGARTAGGHKSAGRKSTSTRRGGGKPRRRS